MRVITAISKMAVALTKPAKFYLHAWASVLGNMDIDRPSSKAGTLEGKALESLLVTQTSLVENRVFLTRPCESWKSPRHVCLLSVPHQLFFHALQSVVTNVVCDTL